MNAVSCPRRGWRPSYQSIIHALFAVFVFSGMISLIEPSPYDFVSLILIPLWAIGGFAVHRSQLLILFLWCVFEICGFAALMPYWSEPDPRLYQLQSLYLFVTVIFFTLFFAERTQQRATLCLKAYTFSALVSTLVGIVGYLDIGGLGAALTTVESRVSGTFKDPNVFGSYMILASTFLLRNLLVGAAKHRLLTIATLLTILFGTFVSYSRGSWGATIFSLTLMTVSAFLTSETRRTRRRILMTGCATAALCVIALLAILSREETRDIFLQRAALAQDYDEGVTGRFGNQLRSLPMLLDRPFGFGPLRFRLIFDLDPHNSYIGAFANDGWIGGFTWILIIATTTFIGFRLILAPSPYRGLAQVFFPTLLALMLQGFQIDIDHWRHVFLYFGAVWGLETARQRRNERLLAAPDHPPARHLVTPPVAQEHA